MKEDLKEDMSGNAISKTSSAAALSSSWRKNFPYVNNLLLSCALLIGFRVLRQFLFHLSDVVSPVLMVNSSSDMENNFLVSLYILQRSILSFLNAGNISQLSRKLESVQEM